MTILGWIPSNISGHSKGSIQILDPLHLEAALLKYQNPIVNFFFQYTNFCTEVVRLSAEKCYIN